MQPSKMSNSLAFLVLLLLLPFSFASPEPQPAAAAASPSFPNLSSTSTSSAAATSAAASSTGGDSAATTTGSGSKPSISFPALSSSFPIPTPTVPPTEAAPFMQTSPLPNNFVFICAGAIIGFIFALILAWRGYLFWNVKRNIKQASARRAPYSALTKLPKFSGEGGSMFKGPNAPFYSHGPGSELSLDPLTGGGLKSERWSTLQNKSNLFFSPTASATAVTQSPSPNPRAQRSSVHLPAGYYAPDKSTQGLSSGRPLSMADFTSNRPHSQGYSNAYPSGHGPSPGPSPLLPAVDGSYGRSSTARMSTVSLGQKSDGRAPSAYLEDLFDYPPVPQRSVSDDSRRQF